MRRQLRSLAQVLEERPWTTEPFLRRLVKERRIPFFKAGGKLLFDLDEVDGFAERGRVEPAAPVRPLRIARPMTASHAEGPDRSRAPRSSTAT